MRIGKALTAALLAIAPLSATAQEPAGEPAQVLLTPEQAGQIDAAGETVAYQSDIARLMRVVVSHLYHERDVFLRELMSNAHDALEKARLLSLTDSSVLSAAPQLNVSVMADPESNRIVIRDTGVGMSKEALVANLGTIARSGTSEFLEKLEHGSGDGGNLIGQFGLGFYSSFLVADKVTVASKSNDDPVQHVFESEANVGSFKIADDPRGNTLGRGTEITLWIKDDAKEFLEPDRLKSLISKHSEYSTTSPIYLWSEIEYDQPIDVAEDEDDDEEDSDDEDALKKVKSLKATRPGWVRVNDRPPLWMRSPKEIEADEYKSFYKGIFKDTADPLTWAHFTGDAGSTTFRALIYVPETVPNDFYSKNYVSLDSLRLYVRRVFITSDVGPDYIPKWLNWVKVFVDADDLPLNVGRDSLQKSRALHQIQRNLTKRILDLFAKLAEEEPEKYAQLVQKAGLAFKVGVVEDQRNQSRLSKLLRFESSASDELVSLDDYVSRRKKGQTQIYFVASVGEKKESMSKSPFVEKIIARGYEVLYFGEPMDEMVAQTLREYEGLQFQDVAKKGLKFGDEDEDEDAKEEEAYLQTTFEPLATFLKNALSEQVDEVVISTRLTKSPCLVVSNQFGWTGNMERLMASQNKPDDFMAQFMRTQRKTFEINPKHPLIEGLLEKVEEADVDAKVSEEMRETVQVLWETALVKSGFSVPDPNRYFELIESMLRRSLGVSESAQARDIDDVKPAPPVETGPVRPSDEGAAGGAQNVFAEPDLGKEWADWSEMRKQQQDAGGAVHDEL